MKSKEKKLADFKIILENVSDSYEDFVSGGIREAKHSDDFIEKVTNFIKDNPTATTSDIIKYETEEIFGIKPLI